jgi:hypothetical protein
MGGPGSGRHAYATTPRVDESLQLDADHITDGVEYPGVTGRKRWGDEDDPLADLTMQFRTAAEAADRATHLELEYTIADRWSTTWTGEESHPVELEYTDCHFGGVRPWFRCPNRECQARVRKLYFPRGAQYWLCRECYDLQYLTSRRSGDDVKTAELRYRRAFRKADAENRRPHPNNAPFRPTRPTGMHHDTFADLVDDVKDARDEWRREVDREMRALLEHYHDDLELSPAPVGGAP